MSRIVATTHDILERVLTMARLVPNVERHLLDDQAEAVGKSSGNASGRHNGISDPTPSMVAALKPYADRERQLYAAIRAINTALDEAERTCVRVLAGKPITDDNELRCPGWNHELRSRLGGCGKVLEHWTDSGGVKHNRSTLLCSSCRLAQARDLAAQP